MSYIQGAEAILRLVNFITLNSMLKKIIKSSTLGHLLWMLFGLIAGLDYFNKKQYLICSILFLIAAIYAYKIVRNTLKFNSKE